MTETVGVRSKNREGMVTKKDKKSDNKGGKSTSKKVSVAKEPRKNKGINKTCEVTAVVQEGNKNTALESKRTSRKGKKNSSDATSVEEKNVQTACDGADHLANNSNTEFAQILDAEDLGKSSEGHKILKRSGESSKRAKKALSQRHRFGSNVITQRTETEIGCSSTDQKKKRLTFQSHSALSPPCNDKEVSCRHNKRTYEDNREKMPKKKVKFSIEAMTKENYDDNDEDTRIDQSFDVIQGARDQLEPKVPIKVDKSISSPSGCIFKKCDTSSTIHCAFCQSFEESEVHLSSEI